MYFYHALIKFPTNSHVWWNYSKDGIVEKVIIPYVNGQVIMPNNEILNLKSSIDLTLFKTEEELDENKDITTPLITSPKFTENICTSEFINLLEQNPSNQLSRSLLQQKYSIVENQVFVIMKFGDKILDSAYEGVIEPVINEFNFKSIRVDKLQDSGKITDQIIEMIATSKYILADLTGERPNTYYETGFAHALGKEVILTIHEGETIHFDLAGNRFIIWDTESDLRNKLRDRFSNLIIDEKAH